MKYKKTMLVLSIVLGVSLIALFGSVVVALVLREQGYEYVPAFLCAGGFSITLIGSAYALVVLSSKIDRAKLQDKKNRALQYKRGRKYFLNNFNGDLLNWVTIQLRGFRCDRIAGGQIFTKQEKNYISVFFVAEYMISGEYKDQLEHIKKLAECVLYDLLKIYKRVSFLECVFLFAKDEWTQQEAEFFESFIGYGDTQSENNNLVKDYYFNYCGVDLRTGQLHFFQTQKSDTGYEADVSFLIKKELKPQCIKVKGVIS